MLKNTYDIQYRLNPGDRWQHYAVVTGAIEAQSAVNSLRRHDMDIVTKVTRLGLLQSAKKISNLPLHSA